MKRIRYKFEAETIRKATRLDIRLLVKNKLIVEGKKLGTTLEWNRGAKVNFISNMIADKKYIRLLYSVGGKDYDYKIYLDEVPSNLGIGTILYFLCPESGKRSRVLISAYGEPKFINREYYHIKYGLRVYYRCQSASHNDRDNARYWQLDGQIKAMEKEFKKPYRKTHYAGKPTKEYAYLQKLRKLRTKYDRRREAIYIKQFNKYFPHLIP